MTYFAIVMLAFALSVDACVVSFSYGISYNTKRGKNLLLLSIFTSVFQGLMPVIGYFLTGFVKSFIQPYSGLIIFLIFTYLGVKFILEAHQEKTKECCIDLKCRILVGIATSIDAFSA
ncbi:manganese efflux pump, partial [bacterium]|nr:manganese efflux pump [bacterium]